MKQVTRSKRKREGKLNTRTNTIYIVSKSTMSSRAPTWSLCNNENCWLENAKKDNDSQNARHESAGHDNGHQPIFIGVMQIIKLDMM